MGGRLAFPFGTEAVHTPHTWLIKLSAKVYLIPMSDMINTDFVNAESESLSWMIRVCNKITYVLRGMIE